MCKFSYLESRFCLSVLPHPVWSVVRTSNSINNAGSHEKLVFLRLGKRNLGESIAGGDQPLASKAERKAI